MKDEPVSVRLICGSKMDLFGMGIALFVYFFNKFVLLSITDGIARYFCQCYLNDLVCPLFFLGCCQIVWRCIGQEIVTYPACLLFGMSGGLVWEYVAPIINSKSVSDPMDLLCYFFGTTLYFLYMWCNRRNSKEV